MICIIGLVSLITVPSFQYYYASTRSKTTLQGLFHHLVLARSKALEQERPVTICPRSDTTQCGMSWQKGWIIFDDADQNRALDKNETIYHETDPINPRDKLVWRGFGQRQALVFNAHGFLKDMTAGAFHYCADTGQEKWVKRALALNVYGRARFSRDENGDGVHEVRKGIPIRCE